MGAINTLICLHTSTLTETHCRFLHTSVICSNGIEFESSPPTRISTWQGDTSAVDPAVKDPVAVDPAVKDPADPDALMTLWLLRGVIHRLEKVSNEPKQEMKQSLLQTRK